MGSYRLSERAKVELDDIWFYVAQASGSVRTASRLINSITDRFSLIAEFPLIGRTREHDLRPGLRSLAAHDYLVIYRVGLDDQVLILHVIDGRRDVPEALTED